MKPFAITCAVWSVFGRYPAHAEDMNAWACQPIAGNLWTVPSAASNPTCKAQILSRQVKVFDRLQDRSEMHFCWHRYPTRW